MTSETFLFDTNIFIEPHQQFYGFDICPGYWDALQKGFESNSIISIQKVYDEILQGEDTLVNWTKTTLGKASFINESADQKVVQKYKIISEWVMGNPQFSPRAKRNFFAGDAADPWICAYAAVHPCIVVTHEAYAPNIQSKVKIPNVLKAFDIPYTNLFDCLRTLEARFHLL